MSIAIQEFLMSSASGGGYFGRNDPRPPIPGKENEPPLSACRNGSSSTRSSGSYRSHISGRSLSSGRSQSSSKSRSSGKSRSSLKSRSSSSGKSAAGNFDRTLMEHNSDRPSLMEKDLNRDSIYLEPEGSANGSRLPVSFVESTPQPACLRWAEDFDLLLADRDGVELFRRFLKEESDSAPLDFLLACRGLSLVDVADAVRIQTLVRTIYKKYVKGDRLGLASELRRQIADRIRYSGIDCSVFEGALHLVEDSLRNGAYLAFLKSEAYLLYVQLGSSGSADNSGGSSDGTMARDQVGGAGHGVFLSTVDEEAELKDTVGSGGYRDLSLTFTDNVLAASRKVCDACMVPMTSARYTSGGSRGFASKRSLSYPYHVSHAPPASKQDSELQSLSSEAMTDDTATSHTTDSTSSVDGLDFGTKTSWKAGKHRSMRRYASVNQHSDLDQLAIIPRTETAPRDRNLAESNPSQFASLLLDRLNKVKNELDQKEKIERLPDSINRTKSSAEMRPPRSHQSTCSSTALPHYPLDYVVFPSGVEIDLDVEDAYGGGGAQRILEEHVSRVWNEQSAAAQRQLNNTSMMSSTSSVTAPLVRGHSLCRFIAPSPNVSGISLGSSYDQFAGSLGTARAPVAASPHRRSFVGGNSWLSSVGDPGRHFHSTPKSKIRAPYLNSFSDSEILDDRDVAEGVEMEDVFPLQNASSRSSSVNAIGRSSYEPQFHSQPDLHDSGRDRFCEPLPVMRTEHRRSALSMAELPNVSRLAALIKSKSSNESLQQHDLSYRDEYLSAAPVRLSFAGAMASQSTSTLPPMNRASSSCVTSLARSESAVQGPRPGCTVVGFYIGDEKIPYRTTIASSDVTLRQFKQLISKRGNYRYFFKTACDDFDSGVIFEEVVADDDVLPMWQGKIVGKVEKTSSS